MGCSLNLLGGGAPFGVERIVGRASLFPRLLYLTYRNSFHVQELG